MPVRQLSANIIQPMIAGLGDCELRLLSSGISQRRVHPTYYIMYTELLAEVEVETAI